MYNRFGELIISSYNINTRMIIIFNTICLRKYVGNGDSRTHLFVPIFILHTYLLPTNHLVLIRSHLPFHIGLHIELINRVIIPPHFSRMSTCLAPSLPYLLHM